MLWTIAVAALLSSASARPPAGADARPSAVAPTDPPTSTVVDNAFFPDDSSTNITDCVSALPRPECGSKERGGWRQGVVFGAIVVGLVGIGTRLVIGVRRRDRSEQNPADDA